MSKKIFIPANSWYAAKTKRLPADLEITSVFADPDAKTPVPNISLLPKVVTLTNAQFKASPTAPISILPAAGAGTMLLLIGGVMDINAAAGAYTNVDPTADAVLKINGAANVSNPFLLTGVIDAAARNLAGVSPVATPNDVDPTGLLASIFSSTDAINKAVSLVVTNGALGAFTGGHANNTVKITLYYLAVTL